MLIYFSKYKNVEIFIELRHFFDQNCITQKVDSLVKPSKINLFNLIGVEDFEPPTSYYYTNLFTNIPDSIRLNPSVSMRPI